jgi:DNA invertase Pin-like site-specific DNA recombinase
MKLGYARVSTDDQNPALQIDALKAAGCEKVFKDAGLSGVAIKRPQLQRCLKSLETGDVLVVWRLDRLGRSLSHLIQTTSDLAERGIGFRSLSEAIDTTSAQGKLLLHVLGALAEFERSLIIERTRAGVQAAKKRGVKLGRKPSLSEQQIARARKMVEDGEPVPEVADLLGVNRATIYRALQRTA